MQPSSFSCEKLMERLYEHAFPYPYNHLNYEYISRVILSFTATTAKFFSMARKYPKICQKIRKILKSEIVNG